ncbi:hypothetical protein OM076_13740 [Solirubrobacter ginsenosidimutans]|uniref:Uncharacterized protein n=1 Tax=Solirubrobacter ginsenosidimutans TaxID=490573 RepID=A0A9X3MRW3_9ACTN|nr:hypothetical protein [Solirubrobacter ginsenosidimutans]MDA0161335.1 hypothetical protein [Solirubrobacter ginsenosidimutans]
MILWEPLEYVFPTATNWYVNRFYLCDELDVPNLPEAPWAQQEANALLTRSEDRLRSLESKGPGLVTVSAIIAAGIGAAIVEAGDDATLIGKALLGLALWYAAWSLAVPLYLVGPQKRSTIDVADLEFAAGLPSPTQHLAQVAVEAAQANTRRTQRIVNLQEAARNEVILALAVLLTWFLLGPATGLLERDTKPAPKVGGPPGTLPIRSPAAATERTWRLPVPTQSSTSDPMSALPHKRREPARPLPSSR